MNTTKIRTIDYAILLLILTIATFARIEKLDSALWYDEIITLIRYVRLPIEDLISTYSSFNNHPFYSLQAKLSVLFFGESNWSIRLPATLFGIASIVAVWRLAYLSSGVLQAHVSALLIALSYHHVWFSQNARGYTEAMFWCVASTVILLNCLKTPSWRKWYCYGLVLAAGIYTHLTTMVFFLAQAIFVIAAILSNKERYFSQHLYLKKEKWLMPFVGFLVAGLLSLLLYSPSIGALFESVISVKNSSSVDVMKEYQSPIWAAIEIVRSIATPGILTTITAFVAIALTGIGIFSIYKKVPLIPVVFILHIILLLSLLLALSMRVWPRFFFIDMGFVLLFITQGVYVCCQYISKLIETNTSIKITGKNLFILASLMMIAISFVLNLKNYQFPKQNFDSPINYIEKHQSKKDRVVTLGLADVPYNEYFNMGWQSIESKEQLEKIESGPSNTRIVIIFPTRTLRKYADIAAHIENNFVLEKTFRGTLGDGNILVYSEKNNNMNQK